MALIGITDNQVTFGKCAAMHSMLADVDITFSTDIRILGEFRHNGTFGFQAGGQLLISLHLTS